LTDLTDNLSEANHHPSRECFMAESGLNGHEQNNNGTAVAIAGNTRDNLQHNQEHVEIKELNTLGQI